MCQYYQHHYTCHHTTYALGKYCHNANLVQTPCNEYDIWQRIDMGEMCESCDLKGGIPVGKKSKDAVKSKGTVVARKGAGKKGEGRKVVVRR